MSRGRDRVIIAREFGNFSLYYYDYEGSPRWSSKILEADKIPRKVARELAIRMEISSFELLDAKITQVFEVLEA